ncbi:MAG TPA: DUF4129 domain-containing protein [Candidatus Methanofastidiosa archaeon]|nr:DUF4129 domain-containing protein [Candidatus Methanofastidiosa archaeon]HPR41249.1 DUF4129 domain-containing protein [Candidatus Methanofastidiosa archaeon]
MRKYHLAIALAIVLMSSCPLAGSPSHQNINEAMEDPEVLHSYFMGDVTIISDAVFHLSQENFQGAMEGIGTLSNDLAVPGEIVLELDTKELEEQLLPLYYRSFQAIYEQLYGIINIQPELKTLLEGLETMGDGPDIGSHIIIADNMLAQIESRLDNLEEAASGLLGLGYETGNVAASISLLRGTLDTYRDSIDALMENNGYQGNGLFISAYDTGSSENYRLIVDGHLYFEGLPVGLHDIGLVINGSAITLETDEDGHFSYLYDLPVNADFDHINIMAQTTYQYETILSDEIEVYVEIPTTISLSRGQGPAGNDYSILFTGRLDDIYGHGLEDRNVLLNINGEATHIVTGEDGLFEHTVQGIDDADYVVYAEFVPEEGAPFVQSRSQALEFSTHVTEAGQGSNNIYEMLLAITVVSGLVIALLVHWRDGHARKDMQSSSPETEGMEDIGRRETFLIELGILEKIGNVKESVILAYSRMIEFLAVRRVVHLHPSTTHTDIDRELRTISDSANEVRDITATFELARYSGRDIGKDRKSSFFRSVRHVVGRIGGGR